MLTLQTLYSETPLNYDGTQLNAHFLYDRFGILGDALVAFEGEASVPLEHMVDKEDVRKKAPIYSPHMLHFLGEWFIDNLETGILLQHLFTANLYQALWELGGSQLKRRGNDLYFSDRKLSVSIATRSPVSVLMHTGINVRTEGTPIPTAGLAELGIHPQTLAQRMLDTFSEDAKVWRAARVKVAPRL